MNLGHLGPVDTQPMGFGFQMVGQADVDPASVITVGCTIDGVVCPIVKQDCGWPQMSP